MCRLLQRTELQIPLDDAKVYTREVAACHKGAVMKSDGSCRSGRKGCTFAAPFPFVRVPSRRCSRCADSPLIATIAAPPPSQHCRCRSDDPMMTLQWIDPRQSACAANRPRSIRSSRRGELADKTSAPQFSGVQAVFRMILNTGGIPRKADCPALTRDKPLL